MISSKHRNFRASMYVVIMMAGAASFFGYSISFMQTVALNAVGVFLFVGGFIALVGHIKKQARIEVLAYPLMVTAAGVWSVISFTGGGGIPGRPGVGLILAASTLSMIDRYWGLRALIVLEKKIEESADA